MLDILKWYFILVSVYFLINYFHFACTTSNRDKIFPSLLEMMNHIRETKRNRDGFIVNLIGFSVFYAIIAPVVAFFIHIS